MFDARKETEQMNLADPSGPLGVRTLDLMPPAPGRRALVRVALDLPFDGPSPTAALRMELLRATIDDLQHRGAQVTVFGDVAVGTHDHGGGPRRVIRSLRQLGAEVILLPREDRAEPTTKLVDQLVADHDLFVNDCFQWSFLALPSLMAAGSRLPCYAGRSLEHDLRIAERLLVDPGRPFTAVLGGDDVLLRLHGLQGMVLRADHVLVGGAMSIPLLQATSRKPGRSTQAVLLDECRAVVGLGERVQHHIHLPRDLVTRDRSGMVRTLPPGRITDEEILDIGPRTLMEFGEVIEGSSAVLWTGAVGCTDADSMSGATVALGRLLPVGSAMIVLGGDALTTVLGDAGCLPPGIQLVTATDALLELMKSGDLPALGPLRDPRRALAHPPSGSGPPEGGERRLQRR